MRVLLGTRRWGCFLNRLLRSQLTINTAIVYMHRFYMVQSFTQFHRNVSVLGAGGVRGAGDPPVLLLLLPGNQLGVARWDRPWRRDKWFVVAGSHQRRSFLLGLFGLAQALFPKRILVLYARSLYY